MIITMVAKSVKSWKTSRNEHVCSDGFEGVGGHLFATARQWCAFDCQSLLLTHTYTCGVNTSSRQATTVLKISYNKLNA